MTVIEMMKGIKMKAVVVSCTHIFSSSGKTMVDTGSIGGKIKTTVWCRL